MYMKELLGSVLGIGLLMVAVFWLWPTPEVWTGYFYPDATNLSNHIETGVFDTLEQCRDQTVSYADSMNIPYGQYDYECGLNCSPRANMGGLNVCEETLQ
jgi:hypothetical protein